MSARRASLLLLGAAVLLTPGVSFALEPEITSDTAAQFYDVRSPTGETVISRRRLMTTLGVSVYDLYDKPEDPNGPSLTFRARMRYDADYGGSGAETDVTNFGRVVPGFDRGPVDLMYGYVEGRRFLRGWLGFKLGRQYVVDALGWWSFDGGSVKITTPYFFAAELYGGLEQRGGMPLSTPRYERDGVWRGDRTGYDPSLYPSFQPNDVAPAYGAALESAGFTWLHGRLTYRRVHNTGASNASQFANGLRAPVAYDGTRISSERLGYAFDGTLPDVGGVKGGLAYDLYNARFANIFGSLDVYASNKVTLSLDYDYFAPTFDGDSIWNFFMSMPMNDMGVRASWDATDKLAIAGGLRGRAFQLQTEPERESTVQNTSPNNLAAGNYYPSSAIEPMAGGNLAARYRWGEGSLGARGSGDFSKNGSRLGLDVYGERTIETRYVVSARTGLWRWDDELRPDRDATSFQYVLGAGYKLFPRSLAFAELEHNMNRIAGHRFRVMLWLTLAVSK
ncbi:MAG: hypothetical protein KF819_24690 [Labilithrix sp.]|nr:hypothetical protein [Labilithrix sp.]